MTIYDLMDSKGVIVCEWLNGKTQLEVVLGSDCLSFHC